MTGGDKWRFTCIYGEVRTEFKYKTWDLLGVLHSEITGTISWLCLGDFNEVLFHHEKEGTSQELKLA